MGAAKGEPQEINSEEPRTPIVPALDSLEALGERWPDILAEMSNRQPLLAGYFFDTELRWKSHPSPILTLVFRNKNAYLLVKNDNTNLKAVASFLRTKLKNPKAFQLRATLPEVSQSQTPQEIPTTKTPPVTSSLGEDELVLREPVIGYILDKFDGELMA